jgi:hypothetical protein
MPESTEAIVEEGAVAVCHASMGHKMHFMRLPLHYMSLGTRVR